MKKIICLLIQVLIFSTVISQNKDKVNIYVKEEIGNDQYEIKTMGQLDFNQNKQIDSISFLNMNNGSKFAIMKNAIIDSLIQNLKKDYNLNFEENETLVIHYKDSLLGYNEVIKYKKPYIHHMLIGDTLQIKPSYRIYKKQRNKLDKNQKKCNKKGLKLGIRHLHFYKRNLNNNFNYENIKWHKSNNFINSIFNNNITMLILKPNGKYYVYNEMSQIIPFKLVKLNDWRVIFTELENYSDNKPYKLIKKLSNTKNREKRTGKGIVAPKFLNKEILRKLMEKYTYNNISSPSCFDIGY